MQRSCLGVGISICASMHAAVVDARGRVYKHLCQHATVVGVCVCVFTFVPACMQQSWMRVGGCAR